MPSLPTTNMTADWDASISANLYASDPLNVPTGSVADGDDVGAWVSTVNANHYWRPYTSVSVFQPPTITWEQDVVLTNPSVKVALGTMEAVTVSTGAELTTDTFHAANAKTLALSFLIEDATLLTNSGTVYLNSVLVGNGKNNYFGTHLRNNGGTLTLSAYNWDGDADHVDFTVTANTKYVLVVTHDGVNLKAWLLTTSGETVGTPDLSGSTSVITGGSGRWLMADSDAAGTEQVKIRVGQITTWDAALTGTDLTDTKDYYDAKWLNNNTICEAGSFRLTGTSMTSLSFSTGGFQAFIQTLDKTDNIIQRTMRLTYDLLAGWTAEFEVKDTDSTASAYRPDLDWTVLLVYKGQLIHKGNIVTVRDRSLAGSDRGVATYVLSKANRIATDQIEVSTSYAAGLTLKAIVTDLFNTYVAPNFSGYVLDPTMLDGPTITETVTFDAVTLQEAFARLTELTGWIIRITPNDVVEAFEPGTISADYALTAANGLAELVGSNGVVRPVVMWEKTRRTFVNRVNVRYGTGRASTTDSFAGDGSTSTFQLTYAIAGYLAYTADGAVGYAVVNYGAGTESLGGLSSSLDWRYDPDAHTITRVAGAPPAATPISILYDVQYPQVVTVEDAASIASVGLFERSFERTDIMDAAEAEELAEGLLRVNSTSPKTITVATRQYPMPFPGDVINLAFADRTITDDDYLITNITAQDFNDNGDVNLAFTLTCVEGLEARRTWTDRLRSALGV